MSVEQNKKLVSQFLEEVFNANKFSAIDNYISINYLDHSMPPGVPAGIEGLKAVTKMVRKGFPDFKFTINQIIAENDMVVAHLTGSGTNEDSFRGTPATGKYASWQEIHIVKINDGKLVEHWAVFDDLSMLQQLGLAPGPQHG